MALWNRKEERLTLRAHRDESTTADLRILFYCASNIGMGPFGLASRLATRIKTLEPEVSILMASDMPGEAAAGLPDVAWMRLPKFQFDCQENFTEKPQFLKMQNGELQKMRANLLQTAVVSFQPDVLVMVTNPHGKRDEMLPALKRIRKASRPCRTVLVMRDIPATPEEKFKLKGARAEMIRHGQHYDRILISGDADFFKAEEAYQWPPEIQHKFRYAGFAVPEKNQISRLDVCAGLPGLDPEKKWVVCAFGGGWESDTLAPDVLEGFKQYAEKAIEPCQLTLFTGAALPENAFQQLENDAKGIPGAFIRRFDPIFPALLHHADLAILQAGSTPMQILESDIPILLSYRPYKSSEQEIRARRLACFPGIRLLEPDMLKAPRWSQWIREALEKPRQVRHTGLSFNGIEVAASEILCMATSALTQSSTAR